MSRSPSLVPCKDETRKTSPWFISIPPKLSETGKRQKRFFATKELALGEVKRIKVRKENHGNAAKLLGPADEQQSASALKLLRESGSEIQLAEIVSEYLKKKRQLEASKPLLEAWDLYTSRTDKKFRKAHLDNLKYTKKRLSPLHAKMVADLSTAELNECLEGAEASCLNAHSSGADGSHRDLASQCR